jgi:hypothetical protein
MFNWIARRRIAKNRQRDGVDQWKEDVFRTLLKSVIPSSEPFYYDAAFSFLQSGDRSELQHPVRITLFFPNYPLAIDIVGADGRSKYNEAQRYLTHSDWSNLQAEIANKAERLSRHRCPYLVINDYDPVDTSNLRDRVRSATGRNLRS